MARLLLADRVKGRQDSFLAPLLPALEREHDVRFVSLGPGEPLAEAIAWADIVWLEWCWDHAVWVTRSGLLRGRPCIVRLHSIEALQTEFPARMDWPQVHRLITVGEDIAELVRARFPPTAGVAMQILPNGIDMEQMPTRDTSAVERGSIAYVGTLYAGRNLSMVFAAISALLRDRPEAASILKLNVR